MNLIRNEFLKQRRHLSIWIGIVLLTVLIIYSFTNTYEHYLQMKAGYDAFVAQHSGQVVQPAPGTIDPLTELKKVLFTENSVSWSMVVLSTLGPIFSCIIGALAIGQEYRFGTLKFLLTVGPSRSRVLWAKILAFALSQVLMILLLLLIGYLTVAIISSIAGFSLQLPSGALLSEFFVTFFGLLLWGIVGFTVALLFKSSLVGVVFGIGWPIIESAFLDQFSIRDALPLWNQKALLAHTFQRLGDIGPANFPLLNGTPGFSTALVISCGYLVVLLLICQVAFRRQQISQ